VTGPKFWRRPWFVPAALLAASVLVQLGGFLALRWVYLGAYGDERPLSESVATSLGHVVFWIAGLAGLAVASAGTYLLVRRSPLLLAIPAVTLVHFPALLVSMAYLYGSLIVSSWL